MIYSGSGCAFLESRIQIWILPLLLKADLEIVKKELQGNTVGNPPKFSVQLKQVCHFTNFCLSLRPELENKIFKVVPTVQCTCLSLYTALLFSADIQTLCNAVLCLLCGFFGV